MNANAMHAKIQSLSPADRHQLASYIRQIQADRFYVLLGMYTVANLLAVLFLLSRYVKQAICFR